MCHSPPFQSSGPTKNITRLAILQPWHLGEEGEIFPNFELLPRFNIDVQPELVNNNFNDENESLILRWRNCTWQQFKSKTKSDLSVWSRWQPSTRKNDFNWFTKNNKCSNMNCLPFISPKRADYKCLQDQTQFNWMVHFINNTERHVCVRASEKGWKMRWCACPTANHSHEWTNRFSTGAVWKQRNEFQQIKQNRAIFVWMKKNKGEKKAIV